MSFALAARLRTAIVLAAGLLLTACDASGEARGGEALFDAAAPPQSNIEEGDAGPNPTWSGIYADLLGPSGKGSCSGDGACHGDPGQSGAQASSFVCGGDKDGCYTSLTGASGLVQIGGDGSKASGLEAIVRKESGGGRMPKRPESVTFSKDDVARIRAWIKNGAKNDG